MEYIFDIPDNVDYGVLTCRTSNGYYEYNFDGADLKQLPPAQPERIKGRWEVASTGYSGFMRCSACKTGCCGYNRSMNFCPNCGADMREVTA